MTRQRSGHGQDRNGTAGSGAPQPLWYFRLTALSAKLGLVVLAAGLLMGAGVWIKDALFTIQPGKGTAHGLSLRTDRHIATLIRTLEPYVPTPNRDRSRDTYRISLFLVPLDGSATRLIPLGSGLSGPSIGLAKVLGSDGQTLWFSAPGIGGIDLQTGQLLTQTQAAAIDPRSLPRPWGPSSFPPKPEHHLAAVLMTSATTWLGLHSDTEVARDFQPRQWLRPVVRAHNAPQPRRFHLGQVEPDTTVGTARIVGIRVADETSYLNAAFLRPGDTAPPIRLDQPSGALMLFTAPGVRGTAIVARVDDRGQLLWRTDTGIDRFKLEQILPGPDATAFVGTRPPLPDKVSEPLLVIVEHGSGKQVTHSLWQ